MSSVPLQAAESWEQMPAFFTAHAATVLMVMSLREHVLLWACVALFLLVGSYAGRYGSVPRFWNLWPADFLRAVSGEDAELSSLGGASGVPLLGTRAFAVCG